MTLPTIDVSAAARAERVSTLDKNYVFEKMAHCIESHGSK